MKRINRRTFVSNSLGVAAGLSIPGTVIAREATRLTDDSQKVPEIIDTNVNLFDWPFRKLKYGTTDALVEKLRKHRVTQAWAGSYEALFHKDINGVNFRLAEECRTHGAGMLLPFGTVNLAWPDWREDLRRCHEVHKMPGIRIYPAYQTFELGHPDFAELVRLVTEHRMLLQIAGDMADSRHHHPIVGIRGVNLEPVVDLMIKIPQARIQLVYWNHRVSHSLLGRLVNETKVAFDTSRVEGAGEVGRLIEGKSWSGHNIAIPADRFMIGSHAPYFPVETNILKLFESPLSVQQMEAVMNGNARRLLKSA